MSIDFESLDYYDKLILYYLSKTQELPNQRELSRKTDINYRTVLTKVQKLKGIGYIQMDSKGQQKLVAIAKKGLEFLEGWKKTAIAGRTITQYDELLERNKSNK
ncbi:MAG: winged helix-turn-helix transcriptional regulator [Candidatus Hodarchaeota archaeon]